MPTPEVLAKAQQLNRKVLAITNGASPLGKFICEQGAIAGATVYALDEDATALARQAISFRQNNLRLRGIPCNIKEERSISDALQDIVSHAPPIDFWIHAQRITPSELNTIKAPLKVFGDHFTLRGKGHASIFIDSSNLEMVNPSALLKNIYSEEFTLTHRRTSEVELIEFIIAIIKGTQNTSEFHIDLINIT